VVFPGADDAQTGHGRRRPDGGTGRLGDRPHAVGQVDVTQLWAQEALGEPGERRLLLVVLVLRCSQPAQHEARQGHFWLTFLGFHATSCPPPLRNFDRIPRIRSERPAFDLHFPELAPAVSRSPDRPKAAPAS
jgi:hypothetical protein